MHTCAIIGVSGGRARGHAEAYPHVKGGKLVAVSSRQRDKLDAFADEFGVPGRYTDYREMFERERPDLVHVNTPPDVRLEIFEAAEEAGVPALIVEKPLAVQWEDFLAIHRFAQTARTKIAINHQLHFLPSRRRLQELVAEGGIGPVRFIEASARMNLAFQGTHSLQGVSAFNPDAEPVAVFGQASGSNGLQESPKRHFAPDEAVAAIEYENDVRAMLRCGPGAPAGGDRPDIWAHKRVAVFGERGYVHWTMWSWEIGRDGQVERGTYDYFDENPIGQAAMTDAMLEWVDDDAKVHPLNIRNGLREFRIVLELYMSALNREVRTVGGVPDAPPQANLTAALRQALEGK